MNLKWLSPWGKTFTAPTDSWSRGASSAEPWASHSSIRTCTVNTSTLRYWACLHLVLLLSWLVFPRHSFRYLEAWTWPETGLHVMVFRNKLNRVVRCRTCTSLSVFDIYIVVSTCFGSGKKSRFFHLCRSSKRFDLLSSRKKTALKYIWPFRGLVYHCEILTVLKTSTEFCFNFTDALYKSNQIYNDDIIFIIVASQ